jgi:hypothetical protein
MPNPSTTKYDVLLQEIPHYQAFSAMMPYVGGDYESEGHIKILLIGESFYFPDGATSNLDPEAWYQSNQSQLTDEEIGYYDCRGLLECSWGSPGHEMYREINRCIGSLELSAEDRPVSNIAFTNAFLRPAVYGDSFKHICTDLDRLKSREITTQVIRALKPDLVVYVSKEAWYQSGQHLAEEITDVKFESVSHPADPRHWNVKSYSDGRAKFIKILNEQFLRPASAL